MVKVTCPFCGSQYPADTLCPGPVCRVRHVDTKREQELDMLYEHLEEHGVIQLEFRGSLDTQRVLINRLRAEWRWGIEVILVEDESGDWYIANLAKHATALGGPLNAVYDVSLDGISPNTAHADFLKFLG